MATRVPYTGIPQVSPQLSPTPTEQVQTPLAAFGGAVAQATQHLGDVEGQAGNELFARGYAMQEFYENTKAQEAATAYTKQIADSSSDYFTKQGQEAVDGLHPYLDGIDKARTDIGNSLDSPYAQQLYNQQTRYVQSRYMMYAGMHAAQQNKEFGISAAKANNEAIGNAAMATPDQDYDTFKTGMDKVRENSAFVAQSQYGAGPNDPQTLELQQKDVSTATSKWLQGLAKTQPIKAAQYYNRATQDGLLTGDDVGRIGGFIQSQSRNVGARNIASDTLSGRDLSFGAGRVAMDQAQMAIGGYESKNNYTITGPTTKSGDHALGRYQVMGANLAPWLKEAGMAPMTQAEFLANPKAQDQLFQFKFGQYMQSTGSFNEAAKLWFTGSTHPRPGATDATPTTAGHTVAQYLQGTNAILAHNASLGDLVAAGRAKATDAEPDDPILGDYVESHIETQYNQQQAIKRNDEFNNQQVIDSALVTGGQGGKIPTNVEELTQDPKVKAAFDALKPSDQLKYINVLAHNAKGDVAWNDGRLRQYQQLKGMAIAQPDEFLKQDIVSQDLPISARKELLNLQGSVFNKSEADPQVGRALQVLRPKLSTLGISSQADPQGYNQFIGSLQDEMQQFTQDNKRPPKDQDIELMGSRLLAEQSSGWFGKLPLIGGQTEMFRVDVPKAAADIIRSDPRWAQVGVDPTDDDIRRIYVRSQYNLLYGKKQSQ